MYSSEHMHDPYLYKKRRSIPGMYVPPEVLRDLSPPPQRKRTYLGEVEEPPLPLELPLGAMTRLKTKRKSIAASQEEMLREEIEQMTRNEKIQNRMASLIALGGGEVRCPPPPPMRPPDVAPPPNEPPQVPRPPSPHRRMLPQPPINSQGKKKQRIPGPTKSPARARGRSKSPAPTGRRQSRQLPKIP